MTPNQKGQEIKIAKEGAFTVLSHPRTVEVFRVIEAELDNLGAFSNEGSVSLGVASTCVGAFITLTLVLFTTTAPASDNWTRPVMIACTLATAVLAVFFGIHFFFKNKKWQELLKNIKSQRNDLISPLEPPTE